MCSCPPSDVERASELAVSLGWHPRHRLTPAFLRVKHAGPFDHPTGVTCDLHWRVFEEAGGGGADDDFRAAAETVTFQGTRLRILSPTDQLLHVCGHAARWDEVPAIRWVADAVLILREGRSIGSASWPTPRSGGSFSGCGRCSATCGRRWVSPFPPRSRPSWPDCRCRCSSASSIAVRNREHRLLGELPTYVFNCWRGEPHPLLAFPGYLRDAWGLESWAEVPRHALTLAVRRARAAIPGGHR